MSDPGWAFWQRTPPHHRAGRPALIRGLAAWLFRWSGWQIVGQVPQDKRLILVIGPHTSNWDFMVGVLAMLALDIRLHFLAKHSLFRPPLGWLMTALGGIAIDRSQPEGFAEATAVQIRASESRLLAITPEGTRSKVTKLKTGFSRIARQVPCSLMPVLLDFGTRTIHLLEPRQATENAEQDAADVRALFATVQGRTPKNF